jgi:ketosteroid isomerase-like protein
MTSEELYQRYVWAGAMTRNADALADLFTADGVLESPLVPPGRAYPRRLEGREQIRTAMAAYYQRSADASPTADASPAADLAASRYQVHTTADPGVFIVEVDAVVNAPAGSTTVSLVQIFRVRDGKIALLRDYFAPEIVD